MPKFRKHPECLLDIVTQVVEDLGVEKKCLVEIDCPASILIPGPLDHVVNLVTTLVSQCTNKLGDAEELAIIGWESDDVCELEIADSGPSVEERACGVPPTAVLAGAEVYWQNCPQGGAAVTARFEKRIAYRKVA